MSYWTYVTGVITVSPMGRTQHEMTYILNTVLDHLPKVTGSERDMNVYVVQKANYNSSCSHNEFGEWIPGDRHRRQTDYLVIIEGSFRDRMFDETKRELNKWLNRLAKRVLVEDICVKLDGQGKMLLITDHEPYNQMYELPTWNNDTGEPAWAEYLMWDSGVDSEYPIMLGYKYFNDPENDAEAERRIAYSRF